MIIPNVTKEKKVTYRDILERVQNNEVTLLLLYIDLEKIPCLISSPLRNDKKPSFRFLKNNENKVHWIDFSTGEKGNLIEFFLQYFNLSYDQLIEKLNRDTGGQEEIKRITVKTERVVKTSELSKYKLGATHRDWTSDDASYWNQFGITIPYLKKANVYPISLIHFTPEVGSSFVVPADKYAYAYYEFKDNLCKCKIYQPYNKQHKWYSNFTEDVWSLWTMLPKTGKDVFITSSLKDALNLLINTGVPAVSMQGEGYLPKDSVIEELKSRFENVWIFFDNDYNNPNNPGRTDAKNLCSKYGLFYVEIPSKYKSKDPSDLFKNHGKETYLKAIKEGLYMSKLFKENIL